MFLDAFFNIDENWSIWGDDLDEGWTELSPYRESMSLPWCHFHSSIWKPAEDLHHGSHAGLHLLNMKVGLVGQGLRPERRPALRSWSCQTTTRLRHGPSKTHKTVECADYGTGSGNSLSWNLIFFLMHFWSKWFRNSWLPSICVCHLSPVKLIRNVNFFRVWQWSENSFELVSLRMDPQALVKFWSIGLNKTYEEN